MEFNLGTTTMRQLEVYVTDSSNNFSSSHPTPSCLSRHAIVARTATEGGSMIVHPLLIDQSEAIKLNGKFFENKAVSEWE